MANNEEYLDSLLKSMNDTEKQEDKDFMTSKEIEEMFAVIDRITNQEEGQEYAEFMPQPATVEEPDIIPAQEGTIGEPTVVEEQPMKEEQSMKEEQPMEEELPVTEELQQEEYSVENTGMMSEQEIEGLLNATAQHAEEDLPATKEEEEISLEDMNNDDLLALLGSLDAQSQLGNIDELIETPTAMEIPAGEEIKAAETAGESDGEKKERKKKEKQQKQEAKKRAKEEKKAAKEEKKAAKVAENKNQKEAAEGQKEKGKGRLSGLFAFFTEEDEESVSEENRAIIEELEAEDLAEARKKKKVKTGKMPQKDKAGETTDTKENQKEKKAKAKKKKQSKPKKERTDSKKTADDYGRVKHISKKSVTVIIAFAVTLFLVVFFVGSYFSGKIQIDRAKKAFQKMDYTTCYAELYGMTLSDEEYEMFKHAELALKMQRRLEVYEMYMEANKKIEALDSLMQAVEGYEEAYAEAMEYGAGAEVAALYDKILAVLENTYGVSRKEAHAIAACESDVEYTRYLTALVQGGLESNGVNVPQDDMQDILPVEEELGNPEFTD